MSTYNVLLVDDEADVAEAVAETIRELGHTVETVANGREAMQRLDEVTTHFDLVLTDIRMPVMDGQELLDNVAESYPQIPVAIMTGHGDMDTAIRAMRSSAFDFLTKPFGYRELKALFSRLPDETHALDLFKSGDVLAFKEELALIIPSHLGSARNLVDYVREQYALACKMMDINHHGFVLCITEALYNAILHGSYALPDIDKDSAEAWDERKKLIEAREADPAYVSKAIDLRIRLTSRRIEVEVRDPGKGFDFQSLPSKEDVGYLRGRGRGLMMIRQLASHVAFEGQGNVIRFRFGEADEAEH